MLMVATLRSTTSGDTMDAVDAIQVMSASFVAEGGPTTEFSTTKENWEAKVVAFRAGTAFVRNAFPGREFRWVVFECETCREDTGGECNLHAAIEATDFCPVGDPNHVLIFDALAFNE